MVRADADTDFLLRINCKVTKEKKKNVNKKATSKLKTYKTNISKQLREVTQINKMK